jgi:hypothetical protein
MPNPQERKDLEARAHKLESVVIIGGKDLTGEVRTPMLEAQPPRYPASRWWRIAATRISLASGEYSYSATYPVFPPDPGRN